MTLEWKDPPPSKKGGRGNPVSEKWRTVADELRAHPGQWAIVAHDVYPSVATQIKKGHLVAFTRGEFEATTRVLNTGSIKVDVWARYVGGVTGE